MVNEKKIKAIEELKDIFKNYKTIMVISVRSLPSKQYQDIKKKIRDKANVKMIKKNILIRAFEESNIDELKKLEKFVEDNCALLFSNNDAFEISGILSKEKSPQKAKEGQEAPEDILVKAGPTQLLPGPDISALSAVGLAPKVESGKISIMQDKVIVKKDQIISGPAASIMAKLDIVPFKVGIEPIAAYMDGKVYDEIKINTEETINNLIEKYSKIIAFSVEISYPVIETIDFILSKAGMQEKAIKSLIKSEELQS